MATKLENMIASKYNVWLLDPIERKTLERHSVNNPKEFALELASGYFEKGKPKSKKFRTVNNVTIFMVDTPTDFYVMYKILE